MKKIILLAASAAAVICILAAIRFYPRPVSVAPSSDPAASNPPAMYMLREYDGHIAIFLAEEQSPFEILDILTESLPRSDRDALKSGIPAANEEELHRLIEDYES